MINDEYDDILKLDLNINNCNLNINKYDLKSVNNDNNIDDKLSNKDEIKDISYKKKGSQPKIKNNKQELNYSFIIQKVLNNIANNEKEKALEDEYKINLLLFSIKEASIKSLCLYFIFRFNEENKNNNSLLLYTIKKIFIYEEKNKNINIKSFIYMLKSFSNILFMKSNYFYSYFFLEKAKTLLKIINGNKVPEGISLFYTDVLDRISRYIQSKCQLFKDKNKINQKKLDDINKILGEILVQNSKISSKNSNNIKNINDEENDDSCATYFYMINQKWIMKVKIFIDYFKIASQEMMEDDFLKNAFNEDYILYTFFDKKDKKEKSNQYNGNILYPGPINNFNLLKYLDAWEEAYNEDENYFLKDNLEINKDYYLISQKHWNILKEIFDSTNEIKRKGNNEYIELKVFILEKRLKKRINKNLLRRRYIQIRKYAKIQKLKEKIIRCIKYEIDKIGKEIDDYYEEKDDYAEMKKMINNSTISFYLLDKENKNVLFEISLAFTNNFFIYNSILLKEIIIGNEEPVNSLFKFFNKKNHILIIEIGEKNSDNFLQVIKPIFNDEKTNNLKYQCNICENEISYNKRYNCGKCNISFFCSETCSDSSGEHIKLHKLFNSFLKPEFNLEKLKNSNFIDDISSRGIVGLFNLGNTCYLNSVVQCLSNTIEFTKYFLLDYYKNEQNFLAYDSKGDIVEKFAKLLKNLWIGNERVISPRDFILTFLNINPQFKGNNQQDAQEFLSLLFLNLHERLNRVVIKPEINQIERKTENENEFETYKRFQKLEKMKNDSIIYDLFNGQFISTTSCEECQKKSITFEQFNILSLPIPKKHCFLTIKYFTENEIKNFPFSINEDTTFAELKDKALTYNKDYIYEKLLKNTGGEINNIYEQEKKNIIYNYNNTKIPQFILYKYIDIVILNKNKMIIYNQKIKDQSKILPYLESSDYEIVLYEKKYISNEYINIYISATYFIQNSKFLFFKKSIYTYSYPVLLSFSKNMFLRNLSEILKNKFKNILNLENIKVEEYKGNPIQIIILHSKKEFPCYFCKKTGDEAPFCLLENLIKKNNTISVLKNEFKDMPILLAADSKYFSVARKCFVNHILFFNEDREDNYENERINIYDCLEKFREEEVLEKDNIYYCDNCESKQKGKKTIQIYKPPPYLIIQLKRFNYNSIMAKIFDKIKIETFVDIPEFLDLKEYVLGPEKNKSIYELYGNILHDEDQHYTAVCQNGGRWILYNDDSLYKSSFPRSPNSYLLFYKKRADF